MPTRLPGPGPLAALRLAPLFARDPGLGAWTLYERYGPVAAMGYGPLRFVYLFGADANRYVLATAPGDFTWREALAVLIPVNGDTALVVSDGADHARRKRIVQPAFHVRRIRSYADIMTAETDRLIASLQPGQVLDLHEALRDVIATVVIRCLFGDELRDRAAELGRHLDTAIAYVQRTPLARLDHPIFPPYRRAMRARAAADQIIYDTIAERRRSANVTERDDVLSWLIEASDPERAEADAAEAAIAPAGAGSLSDVEVRDQIVSLVAAGTDTTTAGAAWAVYGAIGEERVRTRVVTELQALDHPLGLDDLPALPYLHGVIEEALRLHCPAIISGRRASKDFTLHGHVIPAGSMVLYSQFVTHRLPHLWDRPLEFRPERWVPTEPEYREPEPYSFLPFGGGGRRCLGFAFAEQELHLVVGRLLQHVDLEPAWTEAIGRTGIATMAPKGGVPVRVTGVREPAAANAG